jgi:hypothetical protein
MSALRRRAILLAVSLYFFLKSLVMRCFRCVCQSVNLCLSEHTSNVFYCTLVADCMSVHMYEYLCVAVFSCVCILIYA